MKKYILVVFGEFSSYEICKNVAMSITPLVDSPHLKFQRNNGAMIFHFASEVAQGDMKDFISDSLIEFSNSFILTEYTDNLSMELPKDVMEHLLNLDEGREDCEIKINSKGQNIDEDSQEFMTLLLEEIKKEVKRPSLDNILEKIKEKGLNSLTPFEKETLEEYSK